MKRFILVSFSCFYFFIALAGNADTIAVYSSSMHKPVKCVIITPADYSKTKKAYSVIYLLHGYGGNYSKWLTVAPQLKDKADELQVILVCPDGGYGSWWLDSPVDSTVHYETFVTRELLSYIDSSYKTFADRKHRAITGLSMGGHGGLLLSIKHKDLFGAGGSMSGVVDIGAFAKNWNLKKMVGDSSVVSNWANNSVTKIAEGLKNREIKLIFDCGIFDLLIFSNRVLHQKLINLKVEHDYIERPGTHNSAYWKNSIDYQLLFFRKFFDESTAR